MTPQEIFAEVLDDWFYRGAGAPLWADFERKLTQQGYVILQQATDEQFEAAMQNVAALRERWAQLQEGKS